MHILIIGAGGMIGRKLAASLARSGSLGARTITRMYAAAVTGQMSPEDAMKEAERRANRYYRV